MQLERHFVALVVLASVGCSSDPSNVDAGADQSSPIVDATADSPVPIDGSVMDAADAFVPDSADTAVPPGVVATRIPLNNMTGGQPIDAVPSADGKTFYFIGTDKDGLKVFSIPSSGGTPTALCPAGLFVTPVGITISDDGLSLYVADSTYGGKGSLFTLPSGGGNPTVLGGTTNFKPRGVTTEVGANFLAFTGTDPNNGNQGAFRVATAGGAIVSLGMNQPITNMATGITKAANDYWLVDIKSPSIANLVRASMGTVVVPFMVNPTVGAPAGIATKLDGSALLVSTVANGSDALLEVDLPNGQTKSWTGGVSNTDVSPAGLHRAKNVDVYAWCDRGSPGALYNVHWN